MTLLGRLLRRIRYLVTRREMDAAMDEEMRFHIEKETEKNLREGMSPREARRAARVAFGGVERHREATREARGTLLLEDTVRDAAMAVRDMRRNPVATVTAVGSLALGLAATTVVLTLADTFLVRPLEVPEPDRLVAYQEDRTGPNTRTQNGQVAVEYVRYREIARDAGEVAELAAYVYESFAVRAGDVGRGVLGGLVSRNYFRVVGLQPAAGRFFDPALEGPGAPPEVVVSHHFWQTELGGDPDAVGRSIQVDGRPHALVGVAPEGFGGVFIALAPDVWVPADLVVYREGETYRHFLVVFGRLAPDVPTTRAAATLDLLAARTPAETDGAVIRGARLDPLTAVPRAFRGATMGFMGLLVGTAGLVLAVAAANVGGLLLARSAGRSRETAVRLALGAPRSRLVRARVTETLVLFLVAAGLGLLLAFWLTSLAEAWGPPLPVRISLDLTLELRVVALALAVMAVGGLVLGTVTGLQATSRRTLRALREARSDRSPRRQRLRTVFVTAQLAVTVILLVTAGLFARTVGRALAADPGLDPEGLAFTSVSPGTAGYGPAEAEMFLVELLERVRARPGIEAAAGRTAPLSQGANPGEAVLPDDTRVPTLFGHVEGEWFATAGTELVAGRTFGPAEAPGGRPAAVVNQALAERLWPGRSPLGHTFELAGREWTVVGVARDGRYRDMTDEGQSYAFLSFDRGLGTSTRIYLRAADGSTATAMAALREELEAMDPDVAPGLVTTQQEQIDFFLAPQSLAAWLVSGFGVVGMLLAGMGVFGITAFEVARRSREIGVRMALGARRASVARAVVGDALRLAALGLGLGALGALAVSRLVSRFVFGVGLADPWIVTLVPVTLAAVTLLASWLPARRATRVDPVMVLRDA